MGTCKRCEAVMGDVSSTTGLCPPCNDSDVRELRERIAELRSQLDKEESLRREIAHYRHLWVDTCKQRDSMQSRLDAACRRVSELDAVVDDLANKLGDPFYNQVPERFVNYAKNQLDAARDDSGKQS